jgi:crotonobetainyl-CoA:carnitine CoA-transferase CaiB-like acyl-CoA transferase
MFMKQLRQFFYERSQRPEAEPELKQLGPLLADGEWPEQARDQIIAAVRSFTENRTKAELMQLGLRHGILIGSLETVAEVFASAQLAARGFWRMIEHPETGRAFAYPGPFARFSATPISYRRRPPMVGEHNREIYLDELGLGEARLRRLQETGII